MRDDSCNSGDNLWFKSKTSKFIISSILATGVVENHAVDIMFNLGRRMWLLHGLLLSSFCCCNHNAC